MSRGAASQLSFADWELMRQGLELEPLLAAIAGFLDDHEELVTRIRGDLRRGLKQPDTGRSGMAPREVLRPLVLMRVKNWDYRELRERIADGYTLRLFTGFGCRPVPKHNAFHRAFVRLTPATLRVVNELVVKAAVDLGLEDGTKLRVDTTVVQTDIHHPTDNTLLWDAVRVLSRLLGRLGRLLGRRVKGFRNRTRAARRRMQAIQRMSTTQRLRHQTAKYRELIGIAEEVVTCARSVLDKRPNARDKDPVSNLAVAGLRKEIDHYRGLADRVIDQARRRVIDREQVPNAEKIYSIFEPHTDLIKRGKVRSPMEFGHKVFLAESAKGLITQYQVLTRNTRCSAAIRPMSSRSATRCNATRESSVGRLSCTAQIAASSANETSLCARAAASRSCASRNLAAGERLNAKPGRRHRPSSTDSASGPASKDASPCCSAVVA
jgi:IS5 family transposase